VHGGWGRGAASNPSSHVNSMQTLLKTQAHLADELAVLVPHRPLLVHLQPAGLHGGGERNA